MLQRYEVVSKVACSSCGNEEDLREVQTSSGGCMTYMIICRECINHRDHLVDQLESIDFDTVMDSVNSQFEEGFDEFNNFEPFFDAVDAANAYEDDWSELKNHLKPLYLQVYNSIKGIKE